MSDNLNRIEVEDLYREGRKDKEVKEILTKEGDSPCPNRQFKEWWDVFELLRLGRRFKLCELEMWFVLANRFELVRKPEVVKIKDSDTK